MHTQALFMQSAELIQSRLIYDPTKHVYELLQ